jgi:hypothetical protein
MDAHTKASLLGFGVVMLAQVIALVVLHIRSGGGKPGYLEHSIEQKIAHSNRDAFLDRYRVRLAELGFTKGANSYEFFQQEPPLENFGAFPHSKTPKKLTMTFDDCDDDTVMARLTVRYQDLILVDTGESRYAAAVLDYLSGRVDAMQKVPNESLTAWNSFVGGLLAWVLTGLLFATHFRMLWPAIIILGVTEFAVGLFAIASVWMKPGEVVGRGKAVIGILLSVSAVVTSLSYILTAPVDSGP